MRRTLVFHILVMFFMPILQVQAEGVKLNLTPTIYYRPVVQVETTVCSWDEVKEIVDVNGVPLLRLCEKDYNTCLLQGTCIAVDRQGRHVLNYQDEKNGQHYFFEGQSDVCIYGFGVQNICLDPFYSVAADLRYFKPGDVIFVEKLKGVILPDGSTHQGYLIVRDEGGRILGDSRFDFFTGEMNYLDRKNPFAVLGLADQRKRFIYNRVAEPLAEKIRQQRHYPLIPVNGKRQK